MNLPAAFNIENMGYSTSTPTAVPTNTPTTVPTTPPTLTSQPNPNPTGLFERDDSKDLLKFDSKAWAAWGSDPRFIAIVVIVAIVVVLLVCLILWIINKVIQYYRRQHGCTNYGDPTGLHHMYYGPGHIREQEQIPRQTVPLSPTAKAAVGLTAVAVGTFLASQV